MKEVTMSLLIKHHNNIIKVNIFDIKIAGRIFSTGPDEADL